MFAASSCTRIVRGSELVKTTLRGLKTSGFVEDKPIAGVKASFVGVLRLDAASHSVDDCRPRSSSELSEAAAPVSSPLPIDHSFLLLLKLHEPVLHHSQ